MSLKQDIQKQPHVVVMSKVSLVKKLSEGEIPEGGEETEIVAQITVPREGGWGWVVVFASLITITIMDGMIFTFGAMFSNITEDLGETQSKVACINSVAQAMYFMQSPVVSAFINRFGFRAACMTGSLMASFGLMGTYFSMTFPSIAFFYGVLTGTGFSFINVSSLIVGFYFEKLRSLALSISMCGSSLGIMIFYPINSYIVQVAGWRLLILLHAGLNGITFFLAMTYRPLLSLSVTQTVDDKHEPSRTVTYLPSLKNIKQSTASDTPHTVITSTPTERLFSAVANVNYPTASEVVHTYPKTSEGQPGSSVVPTTTAHAPGLALTAQSAPGGISTLQMKQVKSLITNKASNKQHGLHIMKIRPPEKPKKSSCWAKLCRWEKHVPQSRPMYRDDVFYEGELKNLPAYQKSVMDTKLESKTGLEYQLEVTRVASAADIQERQGIFTKATRRVLSTMMTPKMLKKKSFLLFSFSGLILYLGYTVPYLLIQDRNLSFGLDAQHCALFVSAMGFTNVLGRIAIGSLACKLDPLKLYILVDILSGVSTMLSDISHNMYYQYFYSCFFGFFISPTSGLRSIVLVNIYGLENLTNASGLAFLFQGLGSLLCSPVASVIKTNYGYKATFLWAGLCMVVGGLLLMPVKSIANKETKP